MPFVTKFGSKQYIIDYNQQFAVDRIKSAKEGSTIEAPILYVFGEAKSTKTLLVKVIAHTKGKKIRVVKYKNKINYHKVSGFRPYLTILEVVSDGKSKTTEKIEQKTETKEKQKTKITASKKDSAKKTTLESN